MKAISHSFVAALIARLAGIRPLRRGRNLPSGRFLCLAARNVAGCITLSTIVVVLATSLIGCETAAKKPSTDTEPADMAEPEPTLLGTWERTTVGTIDDGTVETEQQTVFVTDTHFSEHNVVLNADGVEIDSWYVVGTVSIAASSVTLTRFEDDGQTAPVEKEYVIVDGALFIHHWGSDGPEVNFDRFTRVGDPPMPGAAALPLRGTWRLTYRWTHDAHGDIVETRALTFTSARAIETASYAANDEVVDYWANSTGWSTSGTTVTRAFLDDDDVMQTVDKEYFIVGDVLAVHHWEDDEPTQNYQLWGRVHDPLPGGLAGTLSGWCPWEDNPVCGRELQPWTFTFGDSFIDEYRSPPGVSPQEVFRATASWQDDPENHFVIVTWQEAVQTIDGSATDDESSQLIGHRGRYAYAPTGIPGHLVFSVWGMEQQYDEETSTWLEHEGNPYGNYWMRLERQIQ